MRPQETRAFPTVGMLPCPSSLWPRGAAARKASCLLLPGLCSEAPLKATVSHASCGRLATQRVVAQALVPGAGVGPAAVGANAAAVAAAVAAVAAAADPPEAA